jgi:hypothetical protein
MLNNGVSLKDYRVSRFESRISLAEIRISGPKKGITAPDFRY